MLYELYLNKYFYFNFILKKNEINKSLIINIIIRMDNEYIDNNDNVRTPDKTKKEQLLQDNRSEYDKQMDEAMYLSIQEFRSLLRNERLFLVVDKPLTRILPELHEDNDDFIINNKIIPANTLVIKKKLQKRQQNKTNILSEKFGLSQ